jgi:glycosyltransferase involved in cell wall biosynthesis
LSVEKGFDVLVAAFAEVAAEHPQWQLEIAGEGPERAALERLIDQHHLDDQARLVGWLEDPSELLRRASIFALSSRYEGFPVSLLEAMAEGVPVVCADCDSGPREIVRHQIDGLLVPPEDPGALAQALKRLVVDHALRQAMATAASDVVERFSLERFAERWEEVLEGAIHPAGSNVTSRQS